MANILEEISPAPRRVMTIFYLIDTSGSMKGARIGAVNAAMDDCRSLLKDVAAANDDADIKIAVMEFSSGFEWVTPATGSVSVEDFQWRDLNAYGLTDFGAALKELDKKLSRNEFLKSQTGAYAPVILLFSDGQPTDQWEEALNKIRANNWFKNAIKIAIDINGESDKNVLAQFTGNVEAIIESNDNEMLKNMIKKVSVRASEFQSHSKSSADSDITPEQDSANIVNSVLAEVDDEQTVTDSTDNQNWSEFQ